MILPHSALNTGAPVPRLNILPRRKGILWYTIEGDLIGKVQPPDPGLNRLCVTLYST